MTKEKKLPNDENVQSINKKPEDNSLDPFDPERLRLTQDFVDTLGVKKALLTVPVRKPSKEWWFQVHPDPSYCVETAILELKEENESYLVNPDLLSELATEVTVGPCALFTAINRQGVLFLWPIKLPGPDGKQYEWHRSALEAAMIAMDKWVRVVANLSLGAYEVFEATGDIPKPKWPEESLHELLSIAFKDRYIDSRDHSVLKRLRGET